MVVVLNKKSGFTAFLCVLAILVCTGCAVKKTPPLSSSMSTGDVVDVAFGSSPITMWPMCTLQQIQQYSEHAESNPREALQGAMCYAVVSRLEPNFDEAGRNATHGLRLAHLALKANPDSALALYVTAALTGLWAQHFPQQGLKAVPKMEALAIQAAKISPQLDHGGPDRLLGELYLKAPEFPVSVGDTQLAVEHYKAAATLAPHFAPNRLGLARAYLEDEQGDKACIEYNRFLALVGEGRPDFGEIPPQILRRACRQ